MIGFVLKWFKAPHVRKERAALVAVASRQPASMSDLKWGTREVMGSLTTWALLMRLERSGFVSRLYLPERSGSEPLVAHFFLTEAGRDRLRELMR